MKRLTASVMFAVVSAAVFAAHLPGDRSVSAQDAAPPASDTLADVRSRGALRCGVATSAIGFAVPQSDGAYAGFDADFCRAVAAAVLGDAEAVEFVTVEADRFIVLAAGGVDVIFRNTTWSQTRDIELGVDFGPITFYDGQQMLGRAEFFTDSSTAADIDGTRVCTNAGTTTEKNMVEAARAAGVEIDLITGESLTEALELYRAGSCDLFTTDNSVLAGERFTAVARGEIEEGEWVIFPPVPFSKEPLAPVYRQNDSRWADVVNWTVFALIIADEKGVTSQNIDARAANPSDPEVARLLGVSDDELQTALGIAPDAFAAAIRAVGNYDEIYARNLGSLGFTREGTANARWTEGGLIYAPPAR